MADAPTQATPATNTTSATAAAAPVAAAAPANAAPRTASPAGPRVTRAGGQTTTNSATAGQPAQNLTGGVNSNTVKNLVESGIFKRMRAILGDTSAEVADKIVTTAKKLWNDFVENNVVPVKNLNEILRRTFRFWTKPAMIVIKPVAKFVGKRLKRIHDRYKKIKNAPLNGGQSSAANLGPGVTNAGSAAAPPPQQASSPSSRQKLPPRGLASKAFAKVASVANAATRMREALGIGHLPGAGANAAKTQRAARPTI